MRGGEKEGERKRRRKGDMDGWGLSDALSLLKVATKLKAGAGNGEEGAGDST